MPVMPPLVSTSSTRKLRVSPKAWPLSHGVSGHGTRSMWADGGDGQVGNIGHANTTLQAGEITGRAETINTGQIVEGLVGDHQA